MRLARGVGHKSVVTYLLINQVYSVTTLVDRVRFKALVPRGTKAESNLQWGERFG
jgi:hypothetical protein